MTRSMNKVILIGNLGGDPEFRTTSDGKEFATFSIATSTVWRDKATEEKKEQTEWHRIAVFSPGLVNVVKNYVKKGSKLYIEGSLHKRKWQDDLGIDRYSIDIVLQNYSSNIILLDSKPSDQIEGNTKDDKLSESEVVDENEKQ